MFKSNTPPQRSDVIHLSTVSPVGVSCIWRQTHARTFRYSQAIDRRGRSSAFFHPSVFPRVVQIEIGPPRTMHTVTKVGSNGRRDGVKLTAGRLRPPPAPQFVAVPRASYPEADVDTPAGEVVADGRRRACMHMIF